MTPSNIRDYVKIYKNFFDKEFCKNIIKEIKNNTWEKHYFYTFRQEFIQNENELSVSWNEGKLEKQLIKSVYL